MNEFPFSFTGHIRLSLLEPAMYLPPRVSDKYFERMLNLKPAEQTAQTLWSRSQNGLRITLSPVEFFPARTYGLTP